MLPRNHPDRIRVSFDDHRLVANAGLLLPATFAHHLGLRELVDHHLDLGVAPGRANTGDKMLTLVASALAGGDCIDNADALRAGGTARIQGSSDGSVRAATSRGPSPAGLRTFNRNARGVAGTRMPSVGLCPGSGVVLRLPQKGGRHEMNLGGFIDTFKDAIARRVVESYPPLYRPSENGGTLPRLLRKPLGA